MAQTNTSMFILALVCFVMIQGAVAAIAATKIELGNKYDEFEIRERNGLRVFQLDIPQHLYQPDKDLIIKVVPEDYESDPDIFISKVNNEPRNSSSSEWQCTAFGKDTCPVHHSNISVGDTFYVGVLCRSSACYFTLHVFLADEIWLEDGVELSIYLAKNDARVFKFRVPAQESNEKEGSSGSNQSITIKASSYKSNVHDFVLTALVNAEGQDTSLPTTNWSSRKGVSAWKQGQVIRLGNMDFRGREWCAGCEIDILMDVVDSGQYHIMAQTNEAVPLLTNYQHIDDIVRYHETQCYKYYVKEEETDLQLALTTYSGQIDVRIHPLKIPSNWDDFSIKRNDTLDTIIDIRPWIRKYRAHAAKGLYFICIKGTQTSTYTLKVREFDQNQRQTTLEDGYQESFFLFQNDMHVHLYRVPKLEYKDEDILIEVDLVIRRGVRPILAGAICSPNTSPEQCRQSITKDTVNSKNSQLSRGRDNGKLIKLIMNHNETYCATELQGDCYYAIAILNPTGNHSMYQITAYHSQNNHILLQEDKPYVDSVNDKRFKYYKYTLLDDRGISNVSFSLTPLHGDSDLYISRNNTFPNKTDNEKMSMRVGSGLDQITFSKGDNKSIVATYYVGVFGYQYASYQLQVHNQKQGESSQHSGHHKDSSFLSEGVTFAYTLQSKFIPFYGCFDVDIDDEDEKSLIIDLKYTENRCTTYAKFNGQASKDDHDFVVNEGINKISRDDRNYHKHGQYCLVVVPEFTVFESFFSYLHYGFRVQYRFESTLTAASTHDVIHLTIQPHQYSYLQHFVVEKDVDIDLILSGGPEQDIYVSYHEANRYPEKDHNDMTTSSQLGSNLSKGKSMYIAASVLQYMNPACVDLGYAENEGCVLYFSVYCNSNSPCQSQITIEYQQNVPKKIQNGSPRHSQLEVDSYSFYYLTVKKSRLSDLYAVLTPIVGDVDLYVNMEPSFKEFDSWEMPTASNYYARSKNKLKTEMIQLTKQDLELCFWANNTEQDECVVIFGVYAQNNSINISQAYFSLVVYMNALELKNDVPVVSYVRQKEFNYFIYEAKCKDCTILFSLSSYTSGKPDMYIVKGGKLPSLNDYDVKKSTLNSDVVQIGPDSDFIKKSNSSSMEGYYIVGVYGYQNTTFSIQVASSQEPLLSLTEGISIRHQQSQYVTTYFQYYSWQVKKDVEIVVAAQLGQVDVYVSTFTSNHTQENFIDRLPKNKRRAIWSSENINSISQVEGKEIVILNEDRNYCVDCMYLIGVATRQDRATYSLVAKSIEAEKNYSNLIKLGETKQIRFNSQGEKKIFQFMLDSKENAQVIPTIISGSVSLNIGFDQTPENAFISQEGSSRITISGENLKTETNYYIIIESSTNQAEITLTIQQSMTVYTMHNGIPQMIRFSDYQDSSKYLMFDFPGGNSTIMVNVKSKTKDFFPLLHYRIYDGYEANNQINFPSSQLQRQQTLIEDDWDKDMYLLRDTMTISQAQEDARLALALQYNKRDGKRQNFPEGEPTYADVIVTMSYSKLMKIAEGEDYLGELVHGSNDFALFKIDTPPGKNLYIEFSQCLGLATYSLIMDPDSFENKIDIVKVEVSGKTVSVVKELQGCHYILVQSLDLGSQSTSKNEYLLKYKYLDSGSYEVEGVKQNKLGLHSSMAYSYVSSDGGNIKYEYLPDKKGSIKLSWGQLYKISNNGATPPSPVAGVKYQIVVSTDQRARLDSVCASKRAVDVIKLLPSSLTQTEYVFDALEQGQELYLNVIAVKDDEQITVPYEPVSLISIEAQSAFGGKWLVALLALLFIIFSVLAFFFYCKGKKLEQKLEIELRDITSADSGTTSTYRRVKPTTGAGANAYNNFADEKNTDGQDA